MSDEGAVDEGGVAETPPDFDPLLAQAQSLPSFLKGTDGNASHVRDVEGDDGGDDEALDDGFGYTPPDPSTFTGD